MGILLFILVPLKCCAGAMAAESAAVSRSTKRRRSSNGDLGPLSKVPSTLPVESFMDFHGLSTRMDEYNSKGYVAPSSDLVPLLKEIAPVVSLDMSSDLCRKYLGDLDLTGYDSLVKIYEEIASFPQTSSLYRAAAIRGLKISLRGNDEMLQLRLQDLEIVAVLHVRQVITAAQMRENQQRTHAALFAQRVEAASASIVGHYEQFKVLDGQPYEADAAARGMEYLRSGVDVGKAGAAFVFTVFGDRGRIHGIADPEGGLCGIYYDCPFCAALSRRQVEYKITTDSRFALTIIHKTRATQATAARARRANPTTKTPRGAVFSGRWARCSY
eukprot:Amastigsp_a677563_49.p1 type:complete len:329 gc:universal Amastigsp_a677563_49:1-987(+)